MDNNLAILTMLVCIITLFVSLFAIISAEDTKAMTACQYKYSYDTCHRIILGRG